MLNIIYNAETGETITEEVEDILVEEVLSENSQIDLKAIAIDKIELATTVSTLKKAVLEYVNVV